MTIFLLVCVVLVGAWSLWGVFGSRVEQAEYSVLEKNDTYEIRLYPARIVAQTTVRGTSNTTVGEGFSIVAGYIFGGNIKKENIQKSDTDQKSQNENKENMYEKIAMTAPVFVENTTNEQTVSFGMPKSYTLETLPMPTDPRVSVVEIPEKKFAVLQFSGYRTEGRIEKKSNELRQALAKDRVNVQDAIVYAGYNAPGTPPWMMRNEVMLEIVE